MAYSDAFSHRVRPVLNALDDVSRLVGHGGAGDAGIQMYKVVVVGDQSSGKSSLIESMFGFELPRGQDIVTRTPIQVEHRYSNEAPHAKLSYIPAGASDYTEVDIDDLDDIEAAVRTATDAVAGEGKGIVDSTIYLRVYTDALPDLTLTDLPGITRNAIEGQPENIEEIVTSMIENHIKGDMVVILCVVPATVDFSTAAAIKLARKHDPQGERTMGVVTKIDLTESGQDMLDRLSGAGNNLKLRLGFIPVRNRTAQELNDGTPLEKVRKAEGDFFRSHPQLSKVHTDRRGIAALVAELARLQMQRVAKSLPDVKKQIREKLDEARRELEAMQGSVVGSESEAQMRLQQLATKLEMGLLRLRQGQYQGLALEGDALKVSRRVYEMADEYRQEVEDACNLAWFLGDECFDALKERSKDSRGVALPNFMSSDAFRSMFTSRVQCKLLAPALDLLVRVKVYMEDEVLKSLVQDTFRAFPRLQAAVCDQVQEMLREQEGAAREYIELLVRQQGLVQTHNHYYMDTVQKIRAASLELGQERLKADSGLQHAYNNNRDALLKQHGQAMLDFIDSMSRSSSNEDQALREMQISLKAYSKVVLKRVYDNVALAVRQLLVEDVGDNLSSFVLEGLHQRIAAAAAAAAAEGGDEVDGFAAVDGAGTTLAGSSLLELMQDPQQARRREEGARLVASLEKAWARLRNINA